MALNPVAYTGAGPPRIPPPFSWTPRRPEPTMRYGATRRGPFGSGRAVELLPMIELLVTYPGLVFIGLSLLVVLDTVSGNLPPAALVPFALGTVVAVILL